MLTMRILGLDYPNDMSLNEVIIDLKSRGVFNEQLVKEQFSNNCVERQHAQPLAQHLIDALIEHPTAQQLINTCEEVYN